MSDSRTRVAVPAHRRRVRIALVSQPIDRILPPIQTSIGACTYGLARALAPSCDVVVYGRKQEHGDAPPSSTQDGVLYKFIPSPAIDRLLERVFPRYAKMLHRVTRCPTPPFSTSPWWYPGYGWRVARDVRAQRCDIIQLQHSSQYAFPVRLLNRASRVVLQIQAEWFPQCHPRLIARRLRYVSLLLAASRHIAGQAVKSFPAVASRCQVLHDGIDPADFTSPGSHTDEPSSPRRLLYVGAVSPHKGLHVLVKAFNVIVERFPDVRLDIVGVHYSYGLNEVFPADNLEAIRRMEPLYQTNYVEALKSSLSPAASARTTFHGAVDRADLLEFYGRADVFVFPSVWNEGFGIPPVEAMAAGVPVIASRVGALPETIVDGSTGILVNPDDPDALAMSALSLLENEELRSSLATNARERALKDFSWERVAQDALLIYDAL